MLSRLINYVKESRQELNKVTWLSRNEIVRYTGAVIIVSVVLALILGGADLAFSFFLTRFIL